MIGDMPFAEELQAAVRGHLRIHPRECEPFSICGAVPKLVVSPASVEEAAGAAKAIAGEGESLIVRGAGSKSFRPPAAPDVFAVMDMSRCDGVLAHEPADLTVTVAAGTKLAHLDNVLQRSGQFFPCDVRFAQTATVGGTLAAAADGALRQRYGGIRDNVLGMRVALSDGSVIFTGSKVVKSVAGYDAHKLFVGSWGTLGAIGEVTLKVAPVPHAQALVAAIFDRVGDAISAALEVARSNLFVLATTLHDDAATRRLRRLPAAGKGWLLVVRCGAGANASVNRQVDGVAGIAKRAGAADVYRASDETAGSVWPEIAELAAGTAYEPERYVVLAIASLGSDVARVIHLLSQAWPAAEITGHPALGVVYAHAPIELAHSVLPALDRIFSTCADRRWPFRLLSAPSALAGQLAPPVAPGRPLELERRVKAAVDPANVFDPRRSVEFV